MVVVIAIDPYIYIRSNQNKNNATSDAQRNVVQGTASFVFAQDCPDEISLMFILLILLQIWNCRGFASGLIDSDKIKLKGLVFHGYHGVLAEVRLRKSNFQGS